MEMDVSYASNTPVLGNTANHGQKPRLMRPSRYLRLAGTPVAARKRRAVAAVELAFCLPIIALIVFGGIETCNMVFLKQAITEAAYHGAIVGTRPSARQADVINDIQAMLDARNIQGTTISVGNSGLPVEDILPGGMVTVRITATSSSNLISPTKFVNSQTVEAIVNAQKL